MILLAPPPSRWVLAGQINSMPPYSCSWSNLHFYINLPPPSTVHYRQRAWCGVPVCIFCKSEVTAAHPVQPYKLGTHILYTYIHIYKHSYIHSYIHSYVIHIHTCIYIHICIHRMILSQISCYICYKFFHKTAKLTTSLFRQSITTEVYKLIHKQTDLKINPQGY